MPRGRLWLCSSSPSTRTQPQMPHARRQLVGPASDVCTLNAALCTPHSERVRVVRANASALVLRICVVRADGECFASVEKQRVVHTINEQRPHISRIKTPLTGLMPSSSTRLTCMSVVSFLQREVQLDSRRVSCAPPVKCRVLVRLLHSTAHRRLHIRCARDSSPNDLLSRM